MPQKHLYSIYVPAQKTLPREKNDGDRGRMRDTYRKHMQTSHAFGVCTSGTTNSNHIQQAFFGEDTFCPKPRRKPKT